MRTIQFALFTILAGLSFLHAGAADKVTSFSSLAKGDELHLTFRTTGCFHYSTYQLTFRCAEETTVNIVQVLSFNSPLNTVPDPSKPTELGELKLSKADLEGLDHLVEYYRSGPKNTCTNVDEITISHHRDGKVTATEKFKDGSCATHSKKELTRIDDLIARLTQKK